MVLTTPIMQALKTGFPRAELTVLANEYNASVIENNPYMDAVFIFREPKEIVQKLRQERFDLIINPLLSPALHSAILTFRLRGKHRIGFEIAGRELFFNLRSSRKKGKKHLIEHHEDLLQAIGLSAKGVAPQIYFTPDELKSVERIFQENCIDRDRLCIAIHPGGFYPSQRWFPERFATVADKLAKSYDAQILLFGGKGDKDALECIQSAMSSPVIVMPELGLREFMATLNRCNLLLCNNSGPLHVAVALGVPTVSTMGPTMPHLWSPVGDIHTVLRKGLPCSPCQRGKCKWHDCMKLITVEEITGAAKVQIEKRMN